MRCTTLKAPSAEHLDRMVGYYAGLAEDQRRRDRRARGPVDYYLDPDEPPGRWWGAGCRALGLAGEVEGEQLGHMIVARHPLTGETLGRGYGKKSARGYDATFSAPKSVSLLWGLSADPWVRAEVLAAHDAAVSGALSWLAGHGAHTRLGTGGPYQVDTRGLVAAVFRQHTSRTADPQLHSHALIWAKVQDTSGKWLALDARLLKDQQRSIGWLYDAALRTELTARLGVAWRELEGGQADLVAVPDQLCDEFSKRSAQVELRVAEVLRRWVDEHDGIEPDLRTLAAIERDAVLKSRPKKRKVADADALRADWQRQALDAGYLLPDVPPGRRSLPGLATVDREAIIDEALSGVARGGSTWLQADLVREVATLVPPGAAPSAEALVSLVDSLATAAAGRCTELHPLAPADTAWRADGRPVTEAVTDRRLSSPAVLAQERRLLAWGERRVRRGAEAPAPVGGEGLDDEQRAAAAAVAGSAPGVLVVGPAGTGKTTTLAAAVATMRACGASVLGVAPSGKAADVLGAEAGCRAVTLAKLLIEHEQERTSTALQLWAGSTVLVDEAGMASTEDLDRLVDLANRRRWRLVLVGDPEQLPAVGRGGMFASWCDTLPTYRLEQVRRFVEPWQAEASRGLRSGESAALAAYAEHRRLTTAHPALLADNVARLHQRLAADGGSVAVTTARVETARAVNQAIQHRNRSRLQGPGAQLADGSSAYIGDRVATRRNDSQAVTDRSTPVRNRQLWTVVTVGGGGDLIVEEPGRGRVVLDRDYVTRHVELGWAVTGYGNQGVTTDHAICVVEPTSSRAGVYVGMTRGRQSNIAVVTDENGLADPVEVLNGILQRPASATTAHATRARLYAERGVPHPQRPPTPEQLHPCRAEQRRPSVELAL